MSMPTLAGAAVALSYEPIRELELVRRHVAKALTELDRRKPDVDRRWRYFTGDHDSLWITSKLREVFGAHFTTKLEDNYCELAVETVVLRLNAEGWQTRTPLGEDASEEDRTAARAVVDQVNTLVDANQLDLEQEELYRAAGVAGDAYLIVWPRYANPDNPDDPTQAVAEDGTPLYDIVLNDSRNVYLNTGAGRRDRRYAVKVWKDDDAKRWRATVYYPDEVVRLQTLPGSTGARPPRADRFNLDPVDTGGPNPLAVVPVFRFARDHARGRSRLDSLRPIQDKINKLSVGKMVAAEFAAMRQRYALLGEDIPDNVLKAVPGSVWKLPAGGPTEDDPANPRTQVGEFSSADLSQFDSAKREEVDAFLTIGMLPRNLRASAGGTASSGEQITKDSGPFVSMVEDHQDMYGGTWRDLWEALGYQVVPAWAPAEFANTRAVAEEVKLLVDAGMPLEVALRHVGWTEEKLEQVRRALEEAAARAANASLDAVRALDQGTSALDLLREGMGAGAVPVMDAATAKAAFDALGVAIRSGVDPEEAAQRVGLGGIRFTGATPASLRLPESQAASLEQK